VQVSFRVPVRGRPALWSPARPALYRVEVETVDGHLVEQDDTVHTGMRSVQVRHGLLYLNGRRLWLRGAAIHEDVDGRGAALSDGDIDTFVSELRSLGANVTRAHYLLSPRLLDALDAAGIMVWAQPPVDHADVALESPAGRRRALSMLRSTLLGDRNHASVVVDSVANELSPNPDATPGTRSYIEQATALSRQLNPGVPVALDTYCYPGYPAQKVYSKLNVLGISSYFGWYPGPDHHSIANFDGLEPFLRQSHARYPHLALAVSEFGAEALFDGPATEKGTYEFQSNYLQRTLGVMNRLPFMNGEIYWTLREFAVSPGWTGGVALPAGAVPDGLHHKGLIAYDDSEKPAFTVAQRLFATQPGFVH
jgi:beta-glucuronidase